MGINAEVSYEGVFTDYVKNQSFSADISELKIKVFGIRIFSLKGELHVSPLKETITPIEPGTEIFALSKEKLNELFESLKEYIESQKN